MKKILMGFCLFVFGLFCSVDYVKADENDEVLSLLNSVETQFSSNPVEKLFLELTTKFHAVDESGVEKFEFDSSLNSIIVKRYVDVFSGLQAVKVKSVVESREVLAYVFGATQIGFGAQKLSSKTDRRDIYTVAAFGLPQVQSKAADEIIADIKQDVRDGKTVHLTGQSLGGILSHSLGYISMYQLKNENSSELMDKINVVSWVLPGVSSMLSQYMSNKYKIKKYKLDKEITSKNFLSIYTSIDPLLKIGEGFGKERVIPVEKLVTVLGRNYLKNNPNIKLRLEMHLYPALKQALDNDLLPDETAEVDNSKKIKISKVLIRVLSYFSYRGLKAIYVKYLEHHGTDADWEKCYKEAKWETNINRKCSQIDVIGCKVGVVYDYIVTGSRIKKIAETEWCLPVLK